MRFKNRENALIWERYVDPYSKLQEFDTEQPDPTVDDAMLGHEDEQNSLEVMEFEPMMEVESSEGCNEVIYSDIKKLAEYSDRILKMAKETEFEPWMQAKLVKASDYVSDIWHRLDAEADFANTGVEHSDNMSL